MNRLATIWGILGVEIILSLAVFRLGRLGLEAAHMPLTNTHLALLAIWTLFMLWAEGWRGFHQKFSPTVVSRAWELPGHATALRVVLAPLFCMGFFYGTRRRKITTWALTSTMIGLVVLLRQVAQPWRGLIDIGVVAGLVEGMGSIAWWALRAADEGGVSFDPQLPV